MIMFENKRGVFFFLFTYTGCLSLRSVRVSRPLECGLLRRVQQDHLVRVDGWQEEQWKQEVSDCCGAKAH